MHYNIQSRFTNHVVEAVRYRCKLFRITEQLAFSGIVMEVVGETSWEFRTGRQTFAMMLGVFDGLEGAGDTPHNPIPRESTLMWYDFVTFLSNWQLSGSHLTKTMMTKICNTPSNCENPIVNNVVRMIATQSDHSSEVHEAGDLFTQLLTRLLTPSKLGNAHCTRFHVNRRNIPH